MFTAEQVLHGFVTIMFLVICFMPVGAILYDRLFCKDEPEPPDQTRWPPTMTRRQ